MARTVDVHWHLFPPSLEREAPHHPEWGMRVQRLDGVLTCAHDGGLAYPVPPSFIEPGAHLASMDDRGIDAAVVSPLPTMFSYDCAPHEGLALARVVNDDLAALVAAAPDRFAALATLPLQDPGLAAGELRRAVEQLGCRGALIGTEAAGISIADSSFASLWETAEQLGTPIVLHPNYLGPRPGMEDYYLTNTAGNPLETALAASRVLLSGMLLRHPSLELVLVHAGGFLPYQLGRLDHAWDVRPEMRTHLTDRRPSELLGRLSFDTVTHHDGALRWLVELAGAERVLMGTDLPTDMGDPDPVRRVERALDADDRALVLGANATRLFDLRHLTGSAPAVTETTA